MGAVSAHLLLMAGFESVKDNCRNPHRHWVAFISNAKVRDGAYADGEY